MASIERTAYPRFGRVVPTRELHDVYTPDLAEVEWARGVTRSDVHLLALVVLLKCFQRLGYFPKVEEIPAVVIQRVRGCLDLAADISVAHDSERTLRHHKTLIRARLGVRFDPEQAREIAEEAIRTAAEVKDNPADLINVALEELIRARCELPGYTTLDELAARVRAEVNGGIFRGIGGRMTDRQRAALDRLLEVDPRTRRSGCDRLKQPAKAATLTRFREHLAFLAWADSLGASERWLEGVPPAKAAHFAAEARVLDAADLGKVGEEKRIALLACLLHSARRRARDEVVGMFIKRMAAIQKRGRTELDEIRERHRAELERLWDVFGDVLHGAREALSVAKEAAAPREPDRDRYERAGRLMLDALEQAGGVEQVSTDHAAISAHHGNNYVPLLERHYRRHRATLFGLLEALQLESTSVDRSVLDAVEFIVAHRHLNRDHMPDQVNGELLNLSFASENWLKMVRDRHRPGRLVRRDLEVCVFCYLADELRTGDVAVVGADAYANYLGQLMSWEECEPLVAGYCAQAGLPATAEEFVAGLRQELTEVAARVDAGYPDNSDLVIDENGHPMLKRRRGRDRRASAIALERLVEDRMPERSVLDVLTRTAFWLRWHRHFGPLSGSDPKLADPLARYVMIAFTYGTNMGPYQASRHLRGLVSPHEISAPANQHITSGKLNLASTDVINSYSRLDVTKLWGDGSQGAADGKQIDTWSDNLLAESSIRYGAYGGLAHRHVSDTYIALFSHFIPCGVWEAVYVFDGLLQNQSEIQPDTIHTDTQGQSLPAYGLAKTLGLDLLPRVRNWQDLIFYRPSPETRYRHIDALFSDDPKNVINWKLIETHWVDLMRTVISVREGRVSSVVLLRRLANDSKKNRLYRAFRELGRVVRTIVLLRYLSEPELREGIAVITNRMESFHNFSSRWLMFGNAGVISDNGPDTMEKILKFNELLANCLIFHTAVDLMRVLNQLQREGYPIVAADVGTLSPYMTKHLRRFGDYVLDLSPPTDHPEARLEFMPGRDGRGGDFR